MKNTVLVIAFTAFLINPIIAQESVDFPLEIGNKFYYQASHFPNNGLFKQIKTIVEILNDGTRKVLVTNYFLNTTVFTYEYWKLIDKSFFISKNLNFIDPIYDGNLTQDTCNSNVIVNECYDLFDSTIFNNIRNCQNYKYSYFTHVDAGVTNTFTANGIGLFNQIKSYQFAGNITKDSINLIGYIKNGVLIGDSVVLNQNKISQPSFPSNTASFVPCKSVFIWNKAIESTSYRLQISTDSLLNYLVFDKPEILDTNILVNLPEYNTKYYWRVETSSIDGEKYLSEINSFLTLDPVYVSLPILPNNNSIISPFDIAFSWNGVNGGLYYTFELSKDFMFSEVLIHQSYLYYNTFQIDSLDFCRDYYWRIQTHSNLVSGCLWSDIYKVSTIGFPLEYKLLQNFPNPFNPNTNISYQLPNAGNVDIKVFDVLGREVATLVDEYKNAGNNEIEFNASNLPSGVYFYQLKSGNYLETKKMIFLK